MEDLAPTWDGLPRALTTRAQASLRALGCEETPSREAASALERLVEARQGRGGDLLRRAFLLLVAAVHAASPFAQPDEPLPGKVPSLPPAPAEWLLLAARERARAAFPSEARHAFDLAIEAVGEAIAARPSAEVPTDSPLADYALALILPAAVGVSDDDGRLARAGEALGRLVRLGHEARALLGAGIYAPLPMTIGRIAAEGGQAERFRAALAHAGKPVPERLPLLSLFGDAAMAARIGATCAAWAEEALEGLDEGARAVVGPLASALSGRITRAAAGARLFGLAPRPPPPEGELDRAIRLAREALVADPELRECWEVQRWGGFFDAPRVARLFPVGLCTLALHAAGEDVSARVKKLVALRSADGYRYYEDYPGIPPDADDLGLALQLAARLSPAGPTPEARDSFAWPVELLVRNTGPDGAVPVWIERHLREPVPDSAPRWLGPRCLGAASNTLIGLAEAEVPLPEGYFDRALAWLVRTWEAEGAEAVFFYDAPFARLLLARLASAAERTPGDPEPRARLRAIVDDIERSIVDEQGVDGGSSGVLATACHLGVLALGRRTPFDPWPAVTYLAARQEPDGLWLREPLYLGPGKDNVPAAHGARSLTAAVCLDALVQARARLARKRGS